MKISGGNDPRISVIIPTFNRPAELRVCLEGFARQTAGAGEFEVVVADDGSEQNIDDVVAPFRDHVSLRLERCEHAGVSVARNLAIESSRAPLLLLYDDDLQPLPHLIEACLRFHSLHAALHEMELLYFIPAPEIAAMAVVQWGFDRLYPFPASPGVFPWEYFWGGSITCKRSLFNGRAFNPEFLAVEDAEFGFRADRAHKLEIHFSPSLSGYFHRPLAIAQICRRQYQMAYYRHWLASRDGVRFAHPVYECPDHFVIADWPSFRSTLMVARPQEHAALFPASPKAQLLSGLWLKAELHAMAMGWLAAQTGGSPISPLFQ